VLLVSDSTAERSAAALDVNVGSRQDPENYQGLAHFLEHMLFLGTEKYPQAGEYQAYISAHGGSHNAYTAFEHTNYFFDIEPQYFEPALDRFAQFFISPLFTESYVEREKNAVHSEYTAKIKDEQRRGSDVFKSIINPQHPFAKLSVGTLQTLAGSGDNADSSALKEQLVDFYQRNYSANIMTLVVVGNNSLAELEAMVTARFAEINNSNKVIDDITQPLFAEQALPLMVTIKPEKALRTLSIAFPTDDDSDIYRQKPMHFLGNILGHEGPGSLLSYLKKQGWSEGLSAGLGLRYEGGATFNITMHLTESGVKHSEQIVAAVFQAIKSIQQTKHWRSLFDEQMALAEQQFRYQQKSAPIHYASRLASGMHYYDSADVLNGPYLISDYQPRKIKYYLSFLRPENSLITLTAPSVTTDKTSHFYHTDYSVKPVAKDQLARWQQVTTNDEIHLPQPNPFIASDFSLLDDPDDNNAEPPALLLDEAGLRLWYKPVDQFKSPRGSVFFSVNSPLASDTVEHKAQLRLLISLISDELNELSYAATLAGLNYSLHPHLRGFSVKISGFNDRQDLLLKKLLAAVHSPALNELRFESIKREHIRKLQNASKKQPYQLIMGDLSDLLYRHSWTDQQLLAAYEDISLSQIKAYKQQLLAAGRINLLVYGNYRQQQAQTYARQIGKSLLKSPLKAQPIDITKLAGTSVARQLNSHYQDASVLVYLQAKDLDKTRRAAMGVSAQMLSADFYTKLRTEQQLGYIVSSGAYPVMDVPGMIFLVQSPVAGPAQLQQQIELYLQQRKEQLAAVSEEEFMRHRDSLLSRLSEAPQNLSEQADRYWQDIGQGYFQFDSRQQLIAAMTALTYPQWQAFFTEDVLDNPRRIVIYTRGKFTDQAPISGESIEDIGEFKLQQSFYPFTTP
jgi:secreted Zn-dependent insulinase-like peptidase